MNERWHGTAGGYNNHKCRCHACTEAWRIVSVPRMQRFRARFVAEGLTQRGTPRKKSSRSNVSCLLMAAALDALAEAAADGYDPGTFTNISTRDGGVGKP